MKEYEVWIYDDESGCNQPMKCKARSVAEARRAGNEYISSWGLVGGMITEIRWRIFAMQGLISGKARRTVTTK